MKQFFVSCPKGVENQLQQELQQLGAQSLRQTVGGVYCDAAFAALYDFCLYSRFANKVIWVLEQQSVADKKAIYQVVRDIPWHACFSVESTFAVDFKGTNRAIKHSNYGALLVKDAVVDCFYEEQGRRPDVEAKHPQVQLYAHLKRDKFLLGIDVSGGSLHRRGYRFQGAKAPLKENLAAALVDRAGVKAGDKRKIYDPMCGSGTLLLEAVMMALDIAPNVLRQRFGFEFLLQHDDKVWQQRLETAKAQRQKALAEAEGKVLAVGFDQDARAIQAAVDNARRAGLDKIIHFKQQALKDFSADEEQAVLLCNPPYGERLQERNALFPLYQQLGEKLRECCQGWQVAILSTDDFLLKAIGLKKSKSYQYFNGALKVQWLLFDIFKREQTEAVAPVRDERFEQGVEMVQNRLRKNLKRLDKWLKKSEIHGYRLYDADMPEYAFALDCYQGESAVYYQVTEYAPPKSVDEFAAFQRRQQFSQAVKRLFELKDYQLVYKERKQQKGKNQYEKLDQSKHFFRVQEGQARLLVNLHDYLDTGLFLDHRPVRLKIAAMANGKRFLNLFCYTAAASVHAALGGAVSSTSVDMSQTYLNWGERNFKGNNLDLKRHQLVRANVLEWLKACEQQFDLVFLDPPSFSNSKRMEGTLDVQRDHAELIDDTMRIVAEDGVLIFSNNRRGFKLDQALVEKYAVTDISRESIDRDFERNQKIHQCWMIRHR